MNNKEADVEKINIVKKVVDILGDEDREYTQNMFKEGMRSREKGFENDQKKRLIEFNESLYDITIVREKGFEKMFFLKKDGSDFLRRDNDDKVVILKILYDNRIPGYNHKKTGAYILLDLLGAQENEKNNFYDYPIIRIIK
jgi:hypothetical protein